MRPSSEVDVIVVGGGAAGVCCAGELVLRGVRPLLIVEAGDVGYQFRAKKMEHGLAIAQYPTRNFYGEGGWWYSLAQRLNVPVKAHRRLGVMASTVLGSGVVADAPSMTSASELATMLASRSPLAGTGSPATLERVLHTGLTMPPEELAALHDVSFAEWLDKVGGDEEVTRLCLAFAASSSFLRREQAEEYYSVYGVFGRLRAYYFGMADMYTIDPDPRRGLFIPMAAEIERRGGLIWRDRRVAHVLTEGDRAVGVVTADGTEARAPVVALAAGSSRLASLFPDGVLPEVEAVATFEAQLGDYVEYTSFAVVDRPFFEPPRQTVSTKSPQGTRIQVDWSVSALAPWATRSGWEMIGTELVRPAGEVEAQGGTEALYAGMREVTEQLFPGFGDATVEYSTEQHPQFISPFLIGPKLPRRSPSLDRLWFVGEGSFPVDGQYTEGAASAGVLGARAIAAFLHTPTD